MTVLSVPTGTILMENPQSFDLKNAPERISSSSTCSENNPISQMKAQAEVEAVEEPETTPEELSSGGGGGVSTPTTIFVPEPVNEPVEDAIIPEVQEKIPEPVVVQEPINPEVQEEISEPEVQDNSNLIAQEDIQIFNFPWFIMIAISIVAISLLFWRKR